MKFKIDENLPTECVEILRQADHDAQTVCEEGLQGKTDAVIGHVCQDEERILVTLDRGFSDIRTYPPSEYPGIIALNVKQQDKTHILALVRRAVELLGTHAIRNSLWVVDENRVRIRQ